MNCPKLTIVLIAYNMARELPRTIRSLSPDMQVGISDSDYEIIVLDNGSTQPFDEQLCRARVPGLSIVHMSNPSPSPVPAVNKGLERARGDLVGVMIDGARLASPGLLQSALEASRLHERPVIGTLGFHLGPEVQMKSVANGYDQKAEDQLLAQAGWEKDGYRLFDISVPAGSSAGGWFEMPAETNALFLKAAQWQDLGGFDPGFVSPGGGLANLDIWVRACADPLARVIMLLGEATFHQVHGGVATNSPSSKWDFFHSEYRNLRGCDFDRPTVQPRYYGSVHPNMLPGLRASVEKLEARHAEQSS